MLRAPAPALRPSLKASGRIETQRISNAAATTTKRTHRYQQCRCYNLLRNNAAGTRGAHGRNAVLLTLFGGVAMLAWKRPRALNTEQGSGSWEEKVRRFSEQAREHASKDAPKNSPQPPPPPETKADDIDLTNPSTASALEDFSKKFLNLSSVRAVQDLAEQSAQLLNDTTQTFEKSITDRVPSATEIGKQIDDLAGSLAKLRLLSDKIPSGTEFTDQVATLWSDVVQNSLEKLVEGTTIESLQHAIKDKDAYPEIEWDATVRVGEALTEAETQFLAERRERVARAVSAFLNEEVDPRDVPVIGIASSGGGCRAMIASLATFETFDRVGLLRGTTYIAGVSGSTWAMSSLYSVGRDWDALRDRLQKQLSDNYLSVRDLVNAINSPDGPQVLMGMAQKYFGDRSFSTVDLYGTLLSARVFLPQVARAISENGKENQKQQRYANDDSRAAGNIHHGPQRNFGKLSDQRWAMTYEDLPLPIYTAVSHEVGKKEAKYQWWEFTPFEVGFQKMLPSQQRLFSAWVPTWSFGRQFEKGESVERLPEISLGLLLGTFGSAFTASVAAIWNEFQDVLPKTLQQRILPLLEDISQVHPISPATFPNPLYHLRRPESVSRNPSLMKHSNSHSLTSDIPTKPDDTDDDLAILNAPTLALMDAGFENNIPFAPLLRQERQVDLVIAVDASMDVGVDPWLRKAEKYAKERGVVFPPLPLPETGDAKGKEVTDDAEARCRIFSTIKDAAHINTRSPETHRQAPSDQSHAPPPLSHDFTLIYLPLLRNPTYSATLDPQRTEWCATHNFTFTPSQTAQLAGLANANVEESLERIRDAVRRAWRAKRARRERRERERWGRKMEDGPAEEF